MYTHSTHTHLNTQHTYTHSTYTHLNTAHLHTQHIHTPTHSTHTHTYAQHTYTHLNTQHTYTHSTRTHRHVATSHKHAQRGYKMTNASIPAPMGPRDDVLACPSRCSSMASPGVDEVRSRVREKELTATRRRHSRVMARRKRKQRG